MKLKEMEEISDAWGFMLELCFCTHIDIRKEPRERVGFFCYVYGDWKVVERDESKIRSH